MPAEMLSGPDLGGGYLHQLSLDTRPTPHRFTYHAQVGGPDANGPPLGPLDPLDFRHPSEPCSFGGPRCWHRDFDIASGMQGRVRQAYNRFRFVVATELEQLYQSRAPTIDDALEEVVTRLGEAPPASEKFWYVGGSVAARLWGADIAPGDIDLGTSREGVDRIAQALAEYLTEPAAPTLWGGSRHVYGARAFVGTMRDGARVEWGSSRESRLDRIDPEFDPETRRVRVGRVEHRGRRLWASRPEYALLRAIAKGAGDAADRIEAAVRAIEPDRALVASLVATPAAPEPVRAEFARRLA